MLIETLAANHNTCVASYVWHRWPDKIQLFDSRCIFVDSERDSFEAPGACDQHLYN